MATARQERSKPLVDALHGWLTAQLGRVSGKSGLAEALNGDFIDGSKAASKAEPQIRGARYPFAEDFARERAQARTAARAAAIHPEEEHIRVHVLVPSLSSIGPRTYKN